MLTLLIEQVFFLITKTGHPSPKVGTLTWYWVYYNYSIGGTTSGWLIPFACLSLLEMNGSSPLILK